MTKQTRNKKRKDAMPTEQRPKTKRKPPRPLVERQPTLRNLNNYFQDIKWQKGREPNVITNDTKLPGSTWYKGVNKNGDRFLIYKIKEAPGALGYVVDQYGPKGLERTFTWAKLCELYRTRTLTPLEARLQKPQQLELKPRQVVKRAEVKEPDKSLAAQCAEVKEPDESLVAQNRELQSLLSEALVWIREHSRDMDLLSRINRKLEKK